MTTTFDIKNEGTTGTARMTLLNEAGVPIVDKPFTAIRATYYSRHSGVIINARNNQDAFDANGFSVDNAGVFRWKRTEADVLIVEVPKPAVVIYRCVVVIEWLDAESIPRQVVHEWDFPIQRADNAPFNAPP